MAGSGAGELDLSAQADPRLVEHDVVACRMRLGRGRHPGGPTADDCDSLPPRGANRRPRQLASGPRVLGARDRDRGVVVRDAGVAADAAEDVVHSPVRGLAWQVGVGDERTRHPDCVGDSVRDEPVGRGRVDDARGRDQRRPDPERRREPGDGALLDRRRRDDSRRAAIGGGVAEGDREVVHEAGELGRDGHGGLGVGREPDAERELRVLRFARPPRRRRGAAAPPPTRPRGG